MEVKDTVLVCETAFKGHHKMQDRWENREYVVEKWPYPNIPVYVVCSRDEEGHSWTLHRNYLLPINSNMGQGKADESEERVKNNTSSTPVPSTDSILQDSPDQPAPVRCDTGTNLPGGIEILGCQQIPGHLASGMHGLTCVSVCSF